MYAHLLAYVSMNLLMPAETRNTGRCLLVVRVTGCKVGEHVAASSKQMSCTKCNSDKIILGGLRTHVNISAYRAEFSSLVFTVLHVQIFVVLVILYRLSFVPYIVLSQNGHV